MGFFQVEWSKTFAKQSEYRMMLNFYYFLLLLIIYSCPIHTKFASGFFFLATLPYQVFSKAFSFIYVEITTNCSFFSRFVSRACVCLNIFCNYKALVSIWVDHRWAHWNASSGECRRVPGKNLLESSVGSSVGTI